MSRPAMRRLLVAAGVFCAVTLAAAPKTTRESAGDPQPALAPSTASNEPGALEEAPPAELRIGDIHFEVRTQPFEDTYVGMTHFDTKVVQIDPSAQAKLRREVFLHELMHVAWHDGKASADKSHKYTEEEAIRQLTPGLLKMLEQNPEAVKYLQK
jgi:hypothetical protein